MISSLNQKINNQKSSSKLFCYLKYQNLSRVKVKQISLIYTQISNQKKRENNNKKIN